ncbi:MULTISPECIES: tRNA (guanosine(46)-N(7))-methyltransferase TrmB [Idiomarinaceae]|uniref:tRNA (guanine(46)-N(7))-methyltransferase n=2 Tax=Pseudidiomarina TaxID=2800384 RepID=A0A368UV23_9GAMM|nr:MULTISPECIES: tRNA (guanine-N(7)-)-methyltransferase [Idiomarinaceae]PWW13399.1 tRNA G46 methylase TrmB [Pseudidiomarina maritima]RBP90866.1 tRNA G46 methylase TrmB [Pseudidiomarina tainanensis]RCW32662.1 tRNA G46 methylase TrmB [Pseudidiomarina tainanensis]
MNHESRPVTTNQHGNHDDLVSVVMRHLRSPFRKPIQTHNREAFEQAQQLVADWQGPLILDSCCGVGESTAWIAEQHPDALVIGVDKSAHRLGRHAQYATAAAGQRYMLVRADLNDFWRLAVAAHWELEKHYILYPNPWPKASHFSRRWHGSPVWPYVLGLGGTLVMRSNWVTYLTEVASSLALVNCAAQLTPLLAKHEAMTPFERKYQRSGQQLWELSAKLPEDGRYFSAIEAE